MEKVTLDLLNYEEDLFYVWRECVFGLVNVHFVPKEEFKLVAVTSANELLWLSDGISFCSKVTLTRKEGVELLIHLTCKSKGFKQIYYYTAIDSSSAASSPRNANNTIGNNNGNEIGVNGSNNTTANSTTNARARSGSNDQLELPLTTSTGSTSVVGTSPTTTTARSSAKITTTLGSITSKMVGMVLGNFKSKPAPKKVPARRTWTKISFYDFYLKFHKLAEESRVLREVDLILSKNNTKHVSKGDSKKLLVDVMVPNVGYKITAVRDGLSDVWRATSGDVKCTTVFAHPKARYSYLHLVIEDNSGDFPVKSDLFFKKSPLRWNRISCRDYFNFFELDFGRTGLNNEVCNLDTDLYCYYYKKICLKVEDLDSEYFVTSESFLHNVATLSVMPRPGFILKDIYLDNLLLRSGYNDHVLLVNLHYCEENLISFYLVYSTPFGEYAIYFVKNESVWSAVNYNEYISSFSGLSYFSGKVNRSYSTLSTKSNSRSSSFSLTYRRNSFRRGRMGALKIVKLNELLKKRRRDGMFMGKIFTSSFKNRDNLTIRTYFSPSENYYNPKKLYQYNFSNPSPTSNVSALTHTTAISSSSNTTSVASSCVTTPTNISNTDSIELLSGVVNRKDRIKNILRRNISMRNVGIKTMVHNKINKIQNSFSSLNYYNLGHYREGAIEDFTSKKNVILVNGLGSNFLQQFMNINIDRFLHKNGFINLNPFYSPRPSYSNTFVNNPHAPTNVADINNISKERYRMVRRYYRRYSELFNNSNYYNDNLLDVFRSFNYSGSLVEMLNKMGYNVYSYDLQSQGLSEGKKDLKCYVDKYEDHVHDLLQFISIVKNKTFFNHSQVYSPPTITNTNSSDVKEDEDEEYILIGYSMGANIALQTIEEYSNSVALLNSGMSPDAPHTTGSSEASPANYKALVGNANLVDGVIAMSGMFNLMDLMGQYMRYIILLINKVTAFFIPTKDTTAMGLRNFGYSLRNYRSFHDAYFYINKQRHLMCFQLLTACKDVFKNISRYPKDLKTLIIHSNKDGKCHINGSNSLFESLSHDCNQYVQLSSNCHSIMDYEYIGILRDIFSKLLTK